MLLIFDTFAVIYITILYKTLGIHVKNPKTVFLSVFNIVILRIWIDIWTEIIPLNNTQNIMTSLLGLIELTLCYIIEDFYGYFIHRYMHYNKTLYNYVHSRHHENQAECFITAFYVHPIELVVFYFVGLIIGPVTISLFWTITRFGYILWLCSATFFLLWSHTGVELDYMPSTKFHNDHHKYYNCNYGTQMTDWVFNTARN